MFLFSDSGALTALSYGASLRCSASAQGVNQPVEDSRCQAGSERRETRARDRARRDEREMVWVAPSLSTVPGCRLCSAKKRWPARKAKYLPVHHVLPPEPNPPAAAHGPMFVMSIAIPSWKGRADSPERDPTTEEEGHHACDRLTSSGRTWARLRPVSPDHSRGNNVSPQAHRQITSGPAQEVKR